MATQARLDTETRHMMPRRVRQVLFAAIGVIFAGALYLISVRGEALLLDLSAISQRVFCF